ncbi:MAG: hypothetical protein U0R19_37720 [Bryobacteraceae bacterium]
MPGSINNAVAFTVLSSDLCRLFTELREIRVLECEFADGSSNRLTDEAVSRRKFRLSSKLEVLQWNVLHDLYLASRGGVDAFYFYFGLETVPLFGHDPTGQNPTGRYAVRFEGDFPLELGVGRIAGNITLVEVA